MVVNLRLRLKRVRSCEGEPEGRGVLRQYMADWVVPESRTQPVNRGDALRAEMESPIDSQIAAWASSQSKVIKNRLVLESLFSEFKNKFDNKNIPKTPHWGGYKVIPQSVEFWQGRRNRMHDRFLYEKKNNKWVINRLSP